MPFCIQCGAKLEDNAKFCTVCGAKQPETIRPSVPAATPPLSSQTSDAAPSAYRYDPTVYTAGEKKTDRKKGGRVLFVILAALVVIAALAYIFMRQASGKGSEDPSDLGVYTAVRAERSGLSVDLSKIWEQGFCIELKAKGKCRVSVDGDEANARWSKDADGSFHIEGSGIDCSGTLKDGVLLLRDVMDTGVDLTFTREGVTLPVESEPEPDPEDPILGVYYAQKGEAMGIEVTISDVWENGLSIELFGDGSCRFDFNGRIIDAKWELDGDSFRILGGSDFSGTLKNGVLMLEDVAGLGVTLYFMKDGYTPPPPVIEETGGSYAEAWEGDYYGFWTIYEVSGSFERSGNYLYNHWDACASIRIDGDEGFIAVWDEDGDDVAQARVAFGPGLTDKGCMTTTEGYFYSNDLSDGVWRVDPGEGMLRDYEGFIVISGRYAESAEDWVKYYIILRPWGMDWEDVKTGDMSDMLYVELMPKYYEDWYLPLIRAGEPMPDDFDGLIPQG